MRLRKMLRNALQGKLWYPLSVDAVWEVVDAATLSGETRLPPSLPKLEAAVVVEWTPSAKVEWIACHMAPGAELALEALVRRTNAIQWHACTDDSATLYFSSCPPDVFAVVSRVACAERGLVEKHSVPCFEWRGQGPPVALDDDSYVLRPLEARHTELVNSTWPHRHPGSEVRIAAMIERLPTMAAFPVTGRRNDAENGGDSSQRIIDGTPVAWILTQPSGEIGMLYTADAHRRKGLAERVVRAVQGVHAEKINCYIVTSNEASSRLFREVMQWEKLGESWWYGLHRARASSDVAPH